MGQTASLILRYRRLCTALLVVVGLSLTAAQGSGPDVASIDRIITNGSTPAFWGIHVQDLSTDAPYHSRNADHGFLPASNQKMLTSATALDAFGSEYRYRTVLYFDGSVNDDGVLRGDLVLRGSGDPTFGSTLADAADPLQEWAQRLADMGVTRFDGRIVGDDNVFDDRPYAEGWDIDYVTSQASRAIGTSVSGLSYRDNVVNVRLQSGSAGSTPNVSTRPEGFVQIRNRLTTANRTRGLSVVTERDFGSERITLRGSLPRSYDGTIVVPVTNPTTFTVTALAYYLREAGIEIEAETTDIDDLDEYEYSTDQPLFVYVSPTMGEILRIVNKESNNFYAEQVFRTLAADGSAEGAENRIKRLLGEAGAATASVEIRDGSGLSRKNMITPEAMTRLLAYMHDHAERDAFLASLARGGEPNSTLRYRLNGVDVVAKTGSLEFVRALSGYVATSSGGRLAFSVFANNYSGPSYQITQTIDRIIMELASAAS